jgi:replicative DNA helicase
VSPDPTIPPQNLEAEASVLGAAMVTDSALPAVIAETHLRPEHFYRERHRIIFAAILRLADVGKPVDALTVSNELQIQGKLQEAGGTEQVSELASTVPAPGNALHYAQIVVEKAQWRHRLEASYLLQRTSLDQDEDGFAVAQAQLGEDLVHATSMVDEDGRRDMLWEIAEGGARAEFPYPFDSLNRPLAGGGRRGEVAILSAYRNEGKSHIAGEMLDLNRKHAKRVCLYDNESSAKKQSARAAVRQHGVPWDPFMRGELDERGRKRLLEHANSGIFWPIVPCQGWTAQEVCHHIRRHGWDMVAIDLLHNFRFKDERELSDMFTLFKATAALANCFILLIAHVNRGGIIGGLRRRPTMSDLRWSGDLENKADIVSFVWRYQVGNLPGARDVREGEGLSQTNLGFLWHDKIRDGDVDVASQAVAFNPGRLRFEARDLLPEERSDPEPTHQEVFA